MRTATTKQLEAEAAKWEATIDWQSCSINCTIDAPDGEVWASNLCHEICVAYASRSESWKGIAFADAIEQMRMGTLKCDDPTCERCGAVEEPHQ